LCCDVVHSDFDDGGMEMTKAIIEGLEVGRCQFCGYICEWDEIPTAADPTSDGTVQCCPECNEGESFDKYFLAKGLRWIRGNENETA
jgi:hypothetical protein